MNSSEVTSSPSGSASGPRVSRGDQEQDDPTDFDLLLDAQHITDELTQVKDALKYRHKVSS